MSKSRLYRACLLAGCALLILRLLPMGLSLIISASAGRNWRDTTLRYFFEWKGLENYISLFTQRESSYYSSFPYIFSDNYFFRALKNSIVLALTSGGLASLMGGLLAACALRLPKRWQAVILCAAAIPAVIPDPCTVAMLLDLCSSDGAVTMLLLKVGLLEIPKNLFSIPLTFSFFYPLMETVKLLFFPTVLALMMGKRYGKHGIVCASALYFLLRMVLFTSFSSVGELMSNPLIFHTADTLGLYAYREGVMAVMFGGSGTGTALDNLRWLLTLAAAIPALVLARRLLRSLKKSRPQKLAGSPVLFALGAVMILLPSLFTMGYILYKGIYGITVLFPELERWGVVKHEYLFNAMLNYLPCFTNSLLICGSAGAAAAGAALCISILLRHKSLRPLAMAAFCWPAGSSALYWALRQTEILNGYPEILTGQVLFWGFPILGGVVTYLYMKQFDPDDMKQYFRLSRPMLWAVFFAVSLLVYSQSTVELARYSFYSVSFSLLDFVEGSGTWLSGLNDFSGRGIQRDMNLDCYAATQWIMAMLLCLPPAAAACLTVKRLGSKLDH